MLSKKDFYVTYSLPYDYVFPEEPFTSFKTFDGDLKMVEPIGFSGVSEKNKRTDLLIFMGFDSSMGSKVIENCDYSKLVLINNLPSFYIKYKDITVVNNYDLMSNSHNYLFTPADNPYEAYNLLENSFSGIEDSVCIAPLSTKPVALGICMFVLENNSVRVVFPVSNSIYLFNTVETYKTMVYHLWFD